MAKVKIEGNTITLDDGICRTNQGIIDALAPYYPAVANANIKRETVKDETIITVTKKAGAKGIFATVFAELEATPEAVSPLAKLGATNWKKAAKVDVDEALLQYLDDEAKLKNLTNALDHAEPVSSKRLPIGF